MATSTDAIQVINGSADSAAKPLIGGRYLLSVHATFGGGNVQVQQLALDETTWVVPMNIAGNANNLTADGSQTMDLSPGTYRIHVVTATAVYAALARVPD